MLFGCYAEVAKEEIEKIDEVDLVLGNHQKANIDRYIESYFEGKELKDEAIDNYFYDFLVDILRFGDILIANDINR